MIGDRDHHLFRTKIESASSFVLTTHIHPDGDALGSQFGMARYLSSVGKQVRIVNVDPTPEILRFIEDGQHPVEVYDPAIHDALLAAVDRVVLVDNSAPDRLGPMERVMRAAADRTLCIDHHPSRKPPWRDRILDEDYCATAVMVYELLVDAGWQVDLPAAEAIYVGLATDTGFFRFNSTSAMAHRVAAQLLEVGVDSARVYRAVYERNSVAYTRLLGHALVGMQLVAGGAIASVALTSDLIQRLGAESVDVSEVTTSLLAMDGISVALLFRELPDERVKVSLRSKGEVDVHELAAEFGGGGHRNASGIVMEGSLDAAVRTVIERTSAQLSRKPPSRR